MAAALAPALIPSAPTTQNRTTNFISYFLQHQITNSWFLFRSTAWQTEQTKEGSSRKKVQFQIHPISNLLDKHCKRRKQNGTTRH